MKTYKGMLSVVCCWCLCLSLCSFSFAANSAAEKPVEENSIVHPLTQKEILNKEIALQKQKEKEIENAKTAALKEHDCVEEQEQNARKISVGDAWKDLTPEQIAIKNAFYAKEEAEKAMNSSSITAVPEAPVLQRKLNDTKDVVVDEPKNVDSLQEKLNYYESNGLARAQANWDFETSDLRCDYVVSMADAYGDGWNGNVLTIGDATFTLDGVNDDGASASACYEGACDVAVTCDGGSWQSEVSWQVADADGNVLLSGGAPFSGSLDCAGGGDDGGTACDFTEYTATCDGGSWQSEVSWTLSNAEGDDTVTGGAPYSEILCLSDTDYTLSMVDAYGDGWNGNTWTLTDPDGATVASCGLDTGAAGECSFSLGGDPPVAGCTDELADNYNPDATVDDGSCNPYCGSDGAYGCGYYLELGYDCETLVGYGYDCDSCYADDACPVLGCTDDTADNYDPGATMDDGSCSYSCANYTVDMADAYGDGWNGNVLTIGDASFTIESGAAAQACYDGPSDVVVTCDGGSWQSEVSWTISDDSGVLLSGGAPYSGCLGDCSSAAEGCTDPLAPNYDADAEVDDGSCEAYCSDADSSQCGYWLGMGYSCEEIEYYGYDCEGCHDDGSCDAGPSFTCPDGTVVGEPEECDGCAYDWTAYGAESCDAAWDQYGITCAELEANYNWNCAGCECPGDSADDGGTGGGDPHWCHGDGIDNDYVLFVGGGSYDSEISFILSSADGDLIAEGNTTANHPDVMDNGGIFLCMEEGGYNMQGFDSWGDGWNGAGWNLFNANNGEWQEGGSLLMSSSYASWDFCLGAEDGAGACSDYGCTLSDSDNYDPGASIDSGSCAWYSGMECQYWWSGASDGFVLGCGTTYEHCWNPAAIGDGICDQHYSGTDYSWGDNHGLACEAFDCDGGDCSEVCADGSETCPYSHDFGNEGHEECADDFVCEGLTVTMSDAYGDGWNGNVLTIGDAEFTINTGDSGEGCYDGPSDVAVTCDGGSWQSEVSWTISDADGNVVLEGGAPYSGCLGTCTEGCTDENAGNYDPDADFDDGTCDYGCADNEVVLVVDGGSWQSEVSWTFAGASGGAPSQTIFCLTDGDYTFTGCDSYGDGWNGNTASFTENGVLMATWDGPSADLGPGECADFTYTSGGDAPVPGCTDENAPNFDPNATIDDGSCEAYCNADELYSCAYYLATGYYSCEELISYGYDCSMCEDECGQIVTCEDPDAYNYGSPGDCVYLPDGWTCPESYAFDSWCDCGCGAYDPTCDDPYASFWDNCGEDGCVDPTSPDCNEGTVWDATITNLTAVGETFEGAPAVQWDWDDLYDGTSCEENGQVTCSDGSCADSEDLCPEDPWADWNEQWAACTGNISWIGDGYCDSSNNNEECGYDYGDCCPSDCEAHVAGDCAPNPGGCYSTISCGDCGTCVDPNSGDLAEGGACADYEQWTDAECAASVVITGGEGCYDDGSAYFTFDWDGGCTATSIVYSGAPDGMDLSAYGFTNGFVFYGFDPGTVDDFFLYFGSDFAFAEQVAADCEATGDDGGGVDCDADWASCLSSLADYDYANGTNWAAECAECADTCAQNPDVPNLTDECYAAAYNIGSGACPDPCAGGGGGCDGLTVDMADSYGDGWNGNVLTIGDESFTIDSGSAAQGCYGGPMDVAVTCDGGSWQSEVSWTISDADGNVLLSGGAPYAGCLGTCEDAGDDGGGGSAQEECEAAGGHYCGDDESNWTSYSPGGCVPSYYICDGWDDCVDASDEADCSSRQSDGRTVNVISTNTALNEQIHASSIANFKKGSVVQPKVELPSTTVLNIATGEITTTGESSRLVSYTINVSCDACLSGGPWSGSWEAATSDFLVYGFDDDSYVCASVIGNSTELGSTVESEAACDNAGGEDECALLDCTGQCADGYESWIGDGYCDDGTYGMFFDCDTFNCDEGDCATDCAGVCGGDAVVDECGECNGDGSSCACDPGDVNGDDSANVQDIVLIVGYILDGSADFDLGCADANGDGAVNVQDIVVIVNMILGGRSAEATEATLNINNGSVSVKANGFVGAVQMTLSHGSDFEIELTDKAMIADYRTSGNSTTLIVVAPDSDNLFTASGDFTIEDVIVANENSQATIVMPTELTLSKAYPNPFNPSTTFDVYVPVEGAVNLSVYNVMGQLVDVIHSGGMTEGSHSITWNASNMTSGIYFVRAESVSGVSLQKVMLMK